MSGSLFDDTQRGFLISAGKRRRMYFHGTGYTFFRNRAKIYGSRTEADRALRIVSNGYARPSLRVEEIKPQPHPKEFAGE